METKTGTTRVLAYHINNHCWVRIETQHPSYYANELMMALSRANVEKIVQKYHVDWPHDDDLEWLEGGQT